MDALDVVLPLVKAKEGLCLRAYPDPASPLSKALSKRNLLRPYKRGLVQVPSDLAGLSGAPWTIGYGETRGVAEGMWWTQAQADEAVRARAVEFMGGVLKRCPQLYLEPPQRLAACTSLAYNIGLGAFGASSVCRLTRRCEYARAADSFLLWNKAGGEVVPGLTARRRLERAMYLS